jgi:hypothetical protein
MARKDQSTQGSKGAGIVLSDYRLLLQRRSQRLTQYSVYAVLEEASRIPGCDRVESPAHRLDQSLPAPALRFAHDAFHLAEGLLYRVQIGGVGRQVKKLATPLFDELSDAISLLSGEIVHHYDLTATQSRGKHLLEVGLEDSSGSRSLHRHRRPHALDVHASEQEGGVRPRVARNRAMCPLPAP